MAKVGPISLTTLNERVTLPILHRVDSISIQYVSGDGTVELQGSNDETTWYPVAINPVDGSAAVAELSAVGAGWAFADMAFYAVQLTAAGAAGAVVALNIHEMG